MNGRQLAAWSGMIGSVLFVVIFMVEGWLRPGYSSRHMLVSELSIGPRGWIQIANFAVCGILLLVFAGGVARQFQTGTAARAGPILLGLIALGFFISGIFVIDPMTTPWEQMTVSGQIHTVVAGLAFLLMPISCFVFWRRFRADPRWRALQRWTLVAGILIAASIAVMIVGPTEPPAPPNVFNTWIGVIQRIALIAYLLWQFIFASQLHKQSEERWRQGGL